MAESRESQEMQWEESRTRKQALQKRQEDNRKKPSDARRKLEGAKMKPSNAQKRRNDGKKMLNFSQLEQINERLNFYNEFIYYTLYLEQINEPR